MCGKLTLMDSETEMMIKYIMGTPNADTRAKICDIERLVVANQRAHRAVHRAIERQMKETAFIVQWVMDDMAWRESTEGK